MSRNEKLFLLHNAIFIIPLSIVGIFINFFIWEKTDSLKAIAFFQLAYAIGILLGSFLSSFVLNQFKANLIRVVGTIFTAFAISLIVIFSNNISDYLILIGFISGLALGLRGLAYRSIFFKIVNTENREKFLNYEKLFSSITTIIVPLAAAMLINLTGNYNFLFIFIIVFFISSTFPLLFLKDFPFEKSKFQIKKAFEDFKLKPDLKKLTFSKFFLGLNIGIDNSVWPILVLFIIGNIGGWGIFNTIFAILSAIITYSLGKRISFSNSKIFLMFMAATLTLVGLIFGSNFDFLSYLIYSFVAGIAATLFDTSYQSMEAKLMDREIDDNESIDEFNILMEIPAFLGRVIIFLVIIFLNPTFENDTILRIFIVVVAAVPLTVSSLLSNIYVAKRSEDPFVKG